MKRGRGANTWKVIRSREEKKKETNRAEVIRSREGKKKETNRERGLKALCCFCFNDGRWKEGELWRWRLPWSGGLMVAQVWFFFIFYSRSSSSALFFLLFFFSSSGLLGFSFFSFFAPWWAPFLFFFFFSDSGAGISSSSFFFFFSLVLGLGLPTEVFLFFLFCWDDSERGGDVTRALKWGWNGSDSVRFRVFE